MKMPSISLCGFYGYKNYGDTLMLDCLSSFLKSSGLSVSVFSDRKSDESFSYKKLDPKINEDGSINSMIDMFGGSGGFTTGYINYLNDKYDNNIDWKNNINKIYHFDMNEDVVKSAGLEFFCLTGELPDMKDNLAYKNSFTDEFNINNKNSTNSKRITSVSELSDNLIIEALSVFLTKGYFPSWISHTFSIDELLINKSGND